MKWKDYEIYIHKHFARLFPDADIKHNVRRKGLISKTIRQIDILVEGKLAGFDISIIVDCKYFNKKVDVKEVESFLSFLADLKASKGILITNNGYSEAAENRATYDTQDIELRIIDFSDLDKFQSFASIVYSGEYCAYLPSPPGWVIDADVFDGAVAAIVPAGLSSREAITDDGFIYVKFSRKDRGLPTLQSLLDLQERRVREQYPLAKFDHFDEKLREEPVLLRIGEISEHYGGLEYSIFIDFGEFILFLVLLAPIDKSDEYLKKLKWIAEKIMPGKMISDSRGRPLSIQGIEGKNA